MRKLEIVWRNGRFGEQRFGVVGRGGSCILNMQCSSAFQNEADLISLDFSEASDMLGEETKKEKKRRGKKRKKKETKQI